MEASSISKKVQMNMVRMFRLKVPVENLRKVKLKRIKSKLRLIADVLKK